MNSEILVLANPKEGGKRTTDRAWAKICLQRQSGIVKMKKDVTT